MNLEIHYEGFDPHLGEIDPMQPWGSRLSNIAFRARRILANRSRGEIQEASLALSWIFDCFLAESYTDGEPDPEAPAPNPVLHRWLEEHHFSAVAELWHRHRQIDIGGMAGFPQATWAELFAVVALSIVASHQIHRSLALALQVPEDEAGRTLLRDIDVVYAMEAVTFAEALSSQAVIAGNLAEEIATRRLQLRNAKAAYVRHGKANAIKQRFLSYLTAGTFPSKREAARRFYAELPEEERRTICPSGHEDNAVRTLTAAARPERD